MILLEMESEGVLNFLLCSNYLITDVAFLKRALNYLDKPTNEIILAERMRMSITILI